ncbi:MAG: AAA family ATPase [Candidatus Altiarchaeales archaeon]|nr:AAA family ATPase [Candidatus Altiarchaeales archaeon]
MRPIKTTKDIKIPEDPLERIVGQETIIEKVKTAIKQRRHLLLVGPPGIGKSMIAQAIAYHLPKPEYEISLINNPETPQHPLVVVKNKEQVLKEKKQREINEVINPEEAPVVVAEKLGFRCARCGKIGAPEEPCNHCGSEKNNKTRTTPFEDMMTEVLEIGKEGVEDQVRIKIRSEKKEGIMVYQRFGNKIRVTDEKELEKQAKKKKQENVIVSLNRKVFVHATGASETELLGDVRHDPYGSHPEIGTPAYLRVVPGAIHEAHEGVLFIDELPHLGNLQNFILTAMQEKKFHIVGRNPQSAGAAVKVEDVPCDFLFVGACNIKDVQDILSPLRSRILGNGYEILMNTHMPDTQENRFLLTRFVAQEIIKDGKIPHTTMSAVEDLIEEARRRAKVIDDARNALTLRLRDLGGVLRMAGDFAASEKSKLIESKHIKEAIEESKPIELQLEERYGSVWKGIEKDQVVNPEYGKLGKSYI